MGRPSTDHAAATDSSLPDGEAISAIPAGQRHELPGSTAGLPHEFDADSASRISHPLVLPVANS